MGGLSLLTQERGAGRHGCKTKAGRLVFLEPARNLRHEETCSRPQQKQSRRCGRVVVVVVVEVVVPLLLVRVL